MQFKLSTLFVAVSIVCVFFAFPLAFSAAAALLVGCMLACGLFTLAIFGPVDKALEWLHRSRTDRDQPRQ
jgi:hypothetical protein